MENVARLMLIDYFSICTPILKTNIENFVVKVHTIVKNEIVINGSGEETCVSRKGRQRDDNFSLLIINWLMKYQIGSIANDVHKPGKYKTNASF